MDYKVWLEAFPMRWTNHISRSMWIYTGDHRIGMGASHCHYWWSTVVPKNDHYQANEDNYDMLVLDNDHHWTPFTVCHLVTLAKRPVCLDRCECTTWFGRYPQAGSQGKCHILPVDDAVIHGLSNIASHYFTCKHIWWSSIQRRSETLALYSKLVWTPSDP
jgi:hypothetical protein